MNKKTKQDSLTNEELPLLRPMKNYVNTLIGCVLLLLCGLTSCSDDNPVYAPVITLESNAVSLKGGGDTYTLHYEVSGAPGGFLLPQVAVDASWLTVTDHSTLGTLTLQAETAAYSVVSRTATLTLTLPEYPDVKAVCTLTQTKNEEAFYIDIEKLGATAVIYSITPANPAQSERYTSYCFSEEEMASLEDKPGAYINAMQQKQVEMSGTYFNPLGPNIDLYFRYDDQYDQREMRHQLEPGHRYCLIAVGFNGSGERDSDRNYSYTDEQMQYATPVVKRWFTTPATGESQPSVSYQVEMTVRGVLADARVTPDRSDVYSYTVNLSQLGYDRLMAGTFPGDTPELLYYYGCSYDYILEYMQQGSFTVQNVQSHLQENTTYYYTVRAYDEWFNPLSDWNFTSYMTTTPQPTATTFEVAFNWDDACRCIYTVTPSDNDPYIAHLFAAAEVEGKSDAELAEMLNQAVYKWETLEGVKEDKEWAAPEMPYVLLVAGAAGDNRTVTTAVTSIPVTIPPLQWSEQPSGTIAEVLKADGDACADAFGWEGCRGLDVICFRFDCSEATDVLSAFFFYKREYDGLSAMPNGESFIAYVARSEGGGWNYKHASYAIWQVPRGLTDLATMAAVPLEENEAHRDTYKAGHVMARDVDVARMDYSTIDDVKRLMGETATRSLFAPRPFASAQGIKRISRSCFLSDSL